ncbi:MBL fold hydrolase [Hypericibacter terrae]|uniref:MBL fold hydrolase n=2 Tax=Hypericibacter terrae TaxID=2602015 RepID=A0A5J6MNB0_9PROT|nr:MBL fold hydrolase [Hypericibacter terrae]
MQRKNTGARKIGASDDRRSSRTDVTKNRGSTPTPLKESPLPQKFPLPTDDSILVCPVGGVGRIGMNWTLYGHAGRWILVDAGSAFVKSPDENGAFMPDPRSLRDVLPRLDGLLVTHAHEDHIGAIHHLWPRIDCPIFATPFAATLLKGRLAEKGAQGKARFKIFKPGDSFKVGPFSIETVPITHSVPECVAMAIETRAGRIFHTGDWKFDPDPLLGDPTDFARLRRVGDRGVLAMLCDSTNAERDAGISSESEVAANLAEVFRTRRGKIAISCFATNLARLTAICHAAKMSGRKVALAGRSLEKAEAAGTEVGLLDHRHTILSDSRHLKGLDPHEILLVCTGTQGEERAALAKLARGESWRLPEIGPGDTVIHSARAIPGNEAAIEEVMKLFRARHVEVLMGLDDEKPLHVTGHASRGELKTMYELIRPQFAIPVHGEADHLVAHGALAQECGARTATLTEEGDLLRVSRDGVERVTKIRIRHLAALESSGEKLVPFEGRVGMMATIPAAPVVKAPVIVVRRRSRSARSGARRAA